MSALENIEVLISNLLIQAEMAHLLFVVIRGMKFGRLLLAGV